MARKRTKIMFKNKCLKDCHTKYLKKYNKSKTKVWNKFIKDSNKYSECVKTCDQIGGRRSNKRNKSIRNNSKRTSRKSRKRTNKSKSLKLNMSEDKYKKLLSKKRLSKKEKKKLDKALHMKYCKCVKSIKYGQKNPGAYAICANSVYKNRGLDMPFRAARDCSKYK